MVVQSNEFWSIDDMERLFGQAPAVSHDDNIDTAILKNNPTVPSHAPCVPTEQTRRQQHQFKRTSAFSRDRRVHHGATKHRNFDDIKMTSLTERGALQEAARCLKCADAPCTKSCPTSIDIKAFIQAISTKNYYGAAQVIMSANPVGLSCGMVCPTSELCVGSCNLAAVEEGPINISGLQEFACSELMRMRVKQTREAGLVTTACHKDARIAIVGGGPAGLSAANYLGRLGYDHITVLDKRQYAGGLSNSEIPQFRCHSDGVQWEVRLCEDLGVKFEYGVELSAKAGEGNVTLADLKAKHDVVLVAVGLQQPSVAKPFAKFDVEHNVYNSKSFLPVVSEGSKVGIKPDDAGKIPKLSGHVLVLGAGDTAFDCVGSAFRCGAKRVTCVFRKAFSDMRAANEERELAIREFADFVSNASPVEVLTNNDGKVRGVKFQRQEQDDVEKPEGQMTGYVDSEDLFTIRCDHVITAFGCKVDGEMKSILDGEKVSFDKNGFVETKDMQKAADGLFCAGDLSGASMTVEAANEGKIAAWGMHVALQHEWKKRGMDHALVSLTKPHLPLFYTDIDNVDISIQMSGVRFPNPFGLASAPSCTSAAMIRRSFEAGWGFAVTKTFSLDECLVTNVSPRIVRGTYAPKYGPGQTSFLNIELITEKTASYWCKAIRELKEDFPDRVVIASIMVGYSEKDWDKITRAAVRSDADIIELNLSCPHGMGEAGMGLACGQDVVMVENICRWVKAAVVDECKKTCRSKAPPVFPKLSNNITEIAIIARAAAQGGADGVTAINTVHGIMDLDVQGYGWPSVGKDRLVTPGGISGDANRPLATRACWSIKRFAPQLDIMATGGVSSALSTVQMLLVGASVVQICSALQNQDFTIVQDYISGLKSYLYQLGRGDFSSRNFQNNFSSRRKWFSDELLDGHPAAHLTEAEKKPKLGEFAVEQRVERSQFWSGREGAERLGTVRARAPCQQADSREKESWLNALERKADDESVIYTASLAPQLKDIQGRTHKRNDIRLHNDLSREEQVTAVINDDMCINCGKCYMTCADSGYQAIEFDAETHVPLVLDDKCTGCGLCQAVCPVPGCIDYRPMSHQFMPTRGLETEHDRYRDEGVNLVAKK